MASKKQIDANRRNAARSTGPKTPAGKATVSRNAIRHGLTSTRAIALPEENLEEFNDLLESLSAQFQPQSPFERSLVLQMATADWRMRRAVRLETGILAYRLDELRGEQGIPRPKPDPSLSAGDRKFDQDTRLLGELFSRNCEGYPQLTLLRYENSARSAYYKALRELRLVQSQRRDQTNPIPPSSEPLPPTPPPPAAPPEAPPAGSPPSPPLPQLARFERRGLPVSSYESHLPPSSNPASALAAPPRGGIPPTVLAMMGR